MKPYQQGDLDSFCGLYSIINATQLVVGSKITSAECERLLSKSIALIEQKRKISEVIIAGLGTRQILKIMEKVCFKKYAILRQKPFSSASVVPLNKYWKTVQEFLNSSKCRAVIISFETKEVSHWSVVSKITHKQIVLFDSSERSRIFRKDCSTKKYTKRKPVYLDPSATYFMLAK